MDSKDETVVTEDGKSPFDDLPNEILEFVLSFLPPYKSLEDCMCVCKRWSSCCKNVLRKAENNLYKAVSEMDIRWKTITPLDMAPSITKRFSHAACVHQDSMYIFGGCTTNSTAFNDLWRFDLSKRQWIRPLAMGTYPTPKAHATMIPYKDCLILFGGWAYPLSVPMSQDWPVYNDIHFYDTTSNRWALLYTANNPPQMSGHSAVVVDDTMVVFGGLYTLTSFPSRSSCDVWVLDLKTMVWLNRPTTDPKPPARYGHSMMRIDDRHLMILGGIKMSKVFNDCWILRMEGSVWTWFEVDVKNKEWSVNEVWCNPACRVGDKVVMLCHERSRSSGPMHCLPSRILSSERPDENSVTQRLEQNMRRSVDKDNNVNGRRGILPHHRPNSDVDHSKDNGRRTAKPSNSEPEAGPSCENVSSDVNSDVNKSSGGVDRRDVTPESNSKKNENDGQTPPRSKNVPGRRGGIKIIRHIRDTYNFKMAAFSTDPSIHTISLDNQMNQRRIANLNERLQHHRIPPVIPPSPVVPVVKKPRRNTLSLHVLDISPLLGGDWGSPVSWLRPREEEVHGAPEEVIMYSLVRGKGELIMFGGLFCNMVTHNRTLSNQFSNSLHFITPPKDVV